MPQITLPIELPAIDLGTIVPIVALVVLAALILATLTARSIIKSRAFGLGLFALIIIAGSSTIVGSLQAIAVLIGVAGVVTIGLVIALNRSPDVTDLLHIAVSRRDTTPQLPPATRYVLPAPRQSEGQGAMVVTQRATANRATRPPEGWGFDD